MACQTLKISKKKKYKRETRRKKISELFYQDKKSNGSGWKYQRAYRIEKYDRCCKLVRHTKNEGFTVVF